MSSTVNTNPFRNDLDPEEIFYYEQRRKCRNNPFYNNYNFQPQYDNTAINTSNTEVVSNKTPLSQKENKLETNHNKREHRRNSVEEAQNFVQEEKFDTKIDQRQRHHLHHTGSLSDHRRKDRSHRKSRVFDGLELDSIDKLDVTNIFSRGRFHHDGPYDAANPQRNSIYNRNAPIMAFPKNSSNNRLTRSHTISNSSSQSSFTNPINRKGTISGQFDSNIKNKIIHGPSSVGLGSTTFLEGAPASQEAIEEDIKNHIRRTRTLKDNRRKSIGDFLRGEFESSNISSNSSQTETQKNTNKKENKFLKRVKSLRATYRI